MPEGVDAAAGQVLAPQIHVAAERPVAEAQRADVEADPIPLFEGEGGQGQADCNEDEEMPMRKIVNLAKFDIS